MHMKSLWFVLSSYLTFELACSLSVRDKRNATSTSSANSTDTDSLDDRFNLNFNVAQAQGYGPHGGHSLSNSLSYGVNAGIRQANGHYQNLYNNAGSRSNGYSSGYGAPLTFANTGSRVRPGHAGGNAAAGVFGGRGSAFAHSQNQNIEIPLDNHGTVLLSNLKAPSNSTGSSASDDKETAEEEKKPSAPAPLSFD